MEQQEREILSRLVQDVKELKKEVAELKKEINKLKPDNHIRDEFTDINPYDTGLANSEIFKKIKEK